MSSNNKTRGGWKTFPYIIGASIAMAIAERGSLSNLVVFLIQEFNMGSIEATQVTNFISGAITISPIFGAIVADATCGCFNVAALSSLAYLLGMMLLTLISTISTLRPLPCSMSSCQDPTFAQLLILYLAITLIGIGSGGTKYNLATLGANQLEDATQQATFFNLYFAFVLYASSLIGLLGIVYIQDNVGWQWGYSLCVLLLVLGLTVLFIGKWSHFRLDEPHMRNPYLALFKAVVSPLVWRNNTEISDDCQGHYFKLENGDESLPTSSKEDQSLKAHSNAADDIKDFNAIFRVLPIAASAVPMSTSVALVMSFSTLQALAMDRHITSYYILPAGSVTVFILLSGTVSILLLDRIIYPCWRRVTGKTLDPLMCIGIAIVLMIATLICSAIMEKMRLRTSQDDARTSVLWLVGPLAMNGLSEAFHVPGLVSLYHQEFPETVRSMAMGLFALTIGAGFYMSIVVIRALKTFTGWLKDDVNDSRVDDIYWVLAVVLLVNLVYYVVCARSYKHSNIRVQ